MNKKQILILFLICCSFFCFSQNSNFPEISELKSKEPVFKEYSLLVANNYKLLAAGKIPDMKFYKFTVTDDGMSLLSIASRCNIPYDTIATLNKLENISVKLQGKTLILPTAPGLFIATGKPKNSLEVLLQEKYFNTTLTKECLYYNINDEEYAFLSDMRFSPTERLFFLDSEMRLPLDRDSYWISSGFGKRKNPFSGVIKDHKGIDLAAAEGTPVYAIKNGEVAYCINDDAIFGNYIIITHDKGSMTSVYAHLSKITVQKYKSVKKGDIIGYVGRTGMTTGPHLHFELRQDGVAQDPEKKLKLAQ